MYLPGPQVGKAGRKPAGRRDSRRTRLPWDGRELPEAMLPKDLGRSWDLKDSRNGRFGGEVTFCSPGAPSARYCTLNLEIRVLIFLPLTSLNFANRLVALEHLGTDVIVYHHHKSKVGTSRHEVFETCRLIFRGPVPSVFASLE